MTWVRSFKITITSHKLQNKWGEWALLIEWLQRNHHVDYVDSGDQMFIDLYFKLWSDCIHLPFLKVKLFCFHYQKYIKIGSGQCSENKRQGKFTDVQGSVSIVWTWSKVICLRTTSLWLFREVSHDWYKCGRKFCSFLFSLKKKPLPRDATKDTSMCLQSWELGLVSVVAQWQIGFAFGFKIW